MATNVVEKQAQTMINNTLVQEVANIYYEAENQMIGELSKNINAMLDDQHWANKQMQKINKMNANIADMLGKKQSIAQSKMEDAILTAYVNGSNAVDIQFGLPRNILQRLDVPASIQRLVLETNGLIESGTLAALRATNDIFRDIQAQVATGVLTGIETRREIAQRMMNSLSDKGIQTFVDKAGRKWSIGSYTEMATRTVTQRAAIQGHLDRQLQLGRDLVQISNHGSSCPLCGPYQGQVFSISGNSSDYPPLSTAIDGGLFHPNCKHSLSGYIPGLSKVDAPLTDAKEYGYTQRQRYNERNIRRWKNREAGALDGKARQKAKAKVFEWQQKQRNLLKQANSDGYTIRRKYERESIKAGKSKVKASTWKIQPYGSTLETHAVKVTKPKPKPKVLTPEQKVDKMFKGKDLQQMKQLWYSNVDDSLENYMLSAIMDEEKKIKAALKKATAKKAPPKPKYDIPTKTAMDGYMKGKTSAELKVVMDTNTMPPKVYDYIKAKYDKVLLKEQKKAAKVSIKSTKKSAPTSTGKPLDITSIDDIKFDEYRRFTGSNGVDKRNTGVYSKVDIIKEHSEIIKGNPAFRNRLNTYSGGSYRGINDYNRGFIKDLDDLSTKQQLVVEKLPKYIEDVATPLKEDSLFYRHFDSKDAKYMVDDKLKPVVEKLVRDVNTHYDDAVRLKQTLDEARTQLNYGIMKDKSFTSTSFHNNVFQGGHGEAEIRYFLPKGYNNGVAMEYASSFDTEHEYLLNAGEEFGIVNIDYKKVDGSNAYNLIFDVVPKYVLDKVLK